MLSQQVDARAASFTIKRLDMDSSSVSLSGCGDAVRFECGRRQAVETSTDERKVIVSSAIWATSLRLRTVGFVTTGSKEPRAFDNVPVSLRGGLSMSALHPLDGSISKSVLAAVMAITKWLN